MKLKVLDLTRVLAGPVCSMMLGDMGADVIKVERPGEGDETRGWGPPFDSDGQSAYFLAVNRNKKSIAADLSNDRDRAIVLDLITGADVVLDNFLSGALGRLGLDPEELLEQNRDLIWCTISGFGAESTRPGYDFVMQAECGWMAITGEKDGSPMKVGIALADVIAGKDAAIAILAVALDRATGQVPAKKRRINISLADSARAALVNVAQNVLVSGTDALVEYTFNTGAAKHRFCRYCGVKSFYIPRSNPDGVDVNVRCIDADTIKSVRVTPFDDGDRARGEAAIAHLSAAD